MIPLSTSTRLFPENNRVNPFNGFSRLNCGFKLSAVNIGFVCATVAAIVTKIAVAIIGPAQINTK